MTYTEALAYLFTATPVFQHIGGEAYKPGLATMQALDAHYQHPHRQYATIHVGGTNGKGSTSHTLAAILQSAGYRVGLFTSPHLIDFRERIRVQGEMISENDVCRFTEQAQELVGTLQPSFFELTNMMALCYFAEKQVDVAIIEVGLGGRLDSSNIIQPILSIITNISLDHTQYLGDTLESIAREKAGIIKPKTPVVIGSAPDASVRAVFLQAAQAQESPVIFAEEAGILLNTEGNADSLRYTTIWGEIIGTLTGDAQRENTATILAAISILKEQFALPFSAIRDGFRSVTARTGLQGRWQTLASKPTIICDTGHNEAGLRGVFEQINRIATQYSRVHIIFGMARDKDVHSIIKLLPRGYQYYFTEASVPRALPCLELQAIAHQYGLEGKAYATVPEAYEHVRAIAAEEDFIFIGGSNFVVADLLIHFNSTTKHS